MSRPLLSIIIPVYNIEKYLKKSLESVMSQCCDSETEIIAINDGSTDASPQILKDVQKRYSGLKIINKPNQGVSKTRNIGIEKAQGDYIFFMDADDILHPQYISIVSRQLRESKPDMLIWFPAAFYRKPKSIQIAEPKISKIDNADHRAFNQMMELGVGVGVWCKAIKRSLLKEDIRFNESMTYGEDMFFCWKATLRAQRINLIHHHLYHYRQSPLGASTKFHPNVFEKYADAFENIRQFIKQEFPKDAATLYSDICYHFACRIPALTKMEYLSNAALQNKIDRLQSIVSHPMIAQALSNDTRLNGNYFSLARNKNFLEMLATIKKERLKQSLLLPLKLILK